MTRGLRGVAMARELLDPRQSGFYAIQLFTHKVLRRLMAIPLLVIAATSAALWDSGPIYRLAVVGQAVVYGLGAIGLGLRGHAVGRRPWFSLPAFFVLVNVASLHAAWNLVSGRRIDRWQPARSAESASMTASGKRVGAPGGSGAMSAPGRALDREEGRQPVSSERAGIAAAVLIILGALAAGIYRPTALCWWSPGRAACSSAMAIVLKPDVATLATIGVIYSNAAVVLVRFHGVPLFVAAAVPLLLVVPFARDVVVRRLPIVAPPAMGWMVVLLRSTSCRRCSPLRPSGHGTPWWCSSAKAC